MLSKEGGNLRWSRMVLVAEQACSECVLILLVYQLFVYLCAMYMSVFYVCGVHVHVFTAI